MARGWQRWVSTWALVVLGMALIVPAPDDAAAVYPLTIDPLAQAAKLTAPGAAGVALGDSVAISADGLTIAVGAPHAAGNHGAVYVFTEPDSGVWTDATPVAQLTASDPTGADFFGFSLAISADGSTIVVGAPDRSGNAGAAYVFTEPSTGWANATQTAELTATDAASNVRVGSSVSLSSDGTTVAAGALNPSALGAAYIFNEPSSGWRSEVQDAKLMPADGTSGDEFGLSVSLAGDGRSLAVGSPSGDGAAYLFTSASETGWNQAMQAAKLEASDPSPGHQDQLGYDLSLAGDSSTLAVGAPGHSTAAGAVYVFARPGSGSWQSGAQTAELTPSDPGADHLGFSVATSDDGGTIAAGGYTASATAGAEYVFGRPASGAWSNGHEAAALAAGDTAAGDTLGFADALSGDGGTVVAGAPGQSSGAGAAYVFAGPKNTSATSVSCSPDPAPAANGSRCTATVSDSGGPDPASIPGGRVVFHPPSPAGAQFAAASCTLTAGRCSVALSSAGGGRYAFSVRYTSDSRHLPSTADGSVTLLPAPTVTTGAVKPVSTRKATLEGTINPNGFPVAGCAFDYGRGASYGSSAACAEPPGRGGSPVAVSAGITGLEPGTTYHYRLRASGPGGAGAGSDRTFTTVPQPLLLGHAAFRSSTGFVYVPVGCVGGSSCHVSVTLRRGRSLVGRRAGATVSADRGAAIRVRVSSRSPGRLTATVSGRGGATARGRIELVRIGGSRSLGPTGSVSADGRAGVVLACARGEVCGGTLELTAADGRTPIAGPARCSVVPGMARVVTIAFTRAGRRWLSRHRTDPRARARFTRAGGGSVTVSVTLASLS